MNINFLKMGFKNYLEELNQNSNKNYMVSNSDASIFMYASEFKEYIQDELSVSTNFLSMSVDDILEMKIENGKLVEADDAGLDTFESTTTKETTTETVVADEVQQTPNENQAQAANGADGEAAMGQVVPNEDFIAEILNTLFQEEEVIEALDTDKSGELNDEEVDAFLNNIKGLDGNAKDISLNDIIESLEAIKNGEITDGKIVEKEDTQVATTNPTTSANNAAAMNSLSTSGVGKTSSGSGVSGNSASGGSTGEKSISDMSKDELNTNLSKTEKAISEKQNELAAVYSGTDSEMAQLKATEEQAYENYQNAVKSVDSKLAAELDACKTAVDNQQSLIDAKDLEITNQKTAVSSAENAYSNAQSSRSNLESTLSSLEGSLSSASDEDKSNINSKISSVKEQIASAKEAEETAKTALEEAKTKLSTLEQEKAALEQEKATLDQNLAAKEQEISAAYPQVAELQQAYDKAKANYAEVKETKASEIKAEISELEAVKNEIKTELTNRVNKETSKENSLSAFSQYDAEKGQKILDAAKSLYGNNTKSGGYCGAGVSNSLYKALGYRMSGDGYMWGDVLENSKDFVEVTDEVTLEDLDDLPAGAVISWSKYEAGHTRSNGKYGHVCIADGNGGEISDFSKEKINIKYGSEWGGTFRVFIPA